MCLGPSVQPPTQKAATYATLIKIITLFQIAISILNFVSKLFVREGVLGLFMALILFMAGRNISHQYIISYASISIFFFVSFLVYVMTMYTFFK